MILESTVVVFVGPSGMYEIVEILGEFQVEITIWIWYKILQRPDHSLWRLH